MAPGADIEVLLDVPQRVQYKLAVMVHRCLGRQAPSYLADYCVPVSTVPGRQHLRSASRSVRRSLELSQ